MASDTVIRVLIVHASRLFREALAFVLARQHDISVAASAGRIGEVIGQLEMLRPDVFLIDLRTPGMAGLDDIPEIRGRTPNAKVLVTGITQPDSDSLACIEAGAQGYLPEDASLQDLVEHIRAVASGEAICSRKVAALLFSRVANAARDVERRPPADSARVTPREREVISLINTGLSNKEIAVRLRIETQTVKNHVHNILEKLQIEGRRELLRYVKDHHFPAIVHGWVLVLFML